MRFSSIEAAGRMNCAMLQTSRVALPVPAPKIKFAWIDALRSQILFGNHAARRGKMEHGIQVGNGVMTSRWFA